jgi:hypothetical protein
MTCAKISENELPGTEKYGTPGYKRPKKLEASLEAHAGGM